jgi:hypothetical protein
MREFVEYVSSFNGKFASQMRGATAEEIAHLQRITGHALPANYREYLELMGHDDDRALGSEEIWTNISEIISFYEENVATGEDCVPDDCIVIGVGGVSVEQVYLEHEGQGRVYDSSDGQKHTLWAESLEMLLYQKAYMRYRRKQFAHTAFYTSSHVEPALGAARDEATRIGFVPQWFSGEVTFCGEMPGATLVINQIAQQGICLLLGAAQFDVVHETALRIAEATGVSLKLVN